ncbi:hypothetical protein Fmac_003973 [Flemingia macrophylla]|uniref:Uncharacterized protein n=1 Tax=Flemingia macrophylla TaxID=520843 RepID=A0ABD1N3L9_9FABA
MCGCDTSVVYLNVYGVNQLFDYEIDKLLHDSPDTVDKIQELLSENEVPLNVENNNLDNPIKDETATDEDENHNLPFPQPKPPEVLIPERGNTESGDQQSNDESESKAFEKRPEVEMSVLKLVRKILIEKGVVVIVTFLP